MTPFDGVALLAMLLAFYPLVSSGELARARRERPEYFAAGELFGSKGDKLKLPDGRVFDLILNAGGLPGSQRWQVIEPGPGGDDPDFALEPGPLTPIDAGDDAAPAPSTDFEQLVAGALEQLGASDAVLAGAGQRVSDDAGTIAIEDGGAGDLDELDAAAAEMDRSRSAEELADVIGQVDALSGAIDSTDSEYDEAPPELQLPNEPGAPAYPGEDGTDGEPGRENPRHPEHPGPTHGDNGE